MNINMDAFDQFREGVSRLPEMIPPAPEMADDERVRRFKKTIIESVAPHQAMDLEPCVHCGACAEACHYYVPTQDAKYTPIRTLDMLRRVYRRVAGHSAPLARRGPRPAWPSTGYGRPETRLHTRSAPDG